MPNDLANVMVEKGLMGAAPEEEAAPEEHEGDSMDACLSDLADEIVSGNKENIVSCLRELVDRIKSDDQSEDESMMDEAS